MESRSKVAIGREGEDQACSFLREKGFEILHRNWRHGHLEIDLIVLRESELHMVEVKTRRLGSLRTGEEAVDKNKQKRLLKAANAYAKKFNRTEEISMDVLVLEYSEEGIIRFRLLENAFYPF